MRAVTSIIFLVLVSPCLSEKSACGNGCDSDSGKGYEFFGGTYAEIDDGDVVNFWFSAAFLNHFTFQVWVKPYNLDNNLRQSVMGSLIDRPKLGQQYFNTAIQIIGSDLHLVSGNHFSISKDLYHSIAEFENRWLHVTASFSSDEAGGTGRLFFNGVQVAQASSLGPCVWTGVPFFLARSFDEGWNFFGQLDEIRVWNFTMGQDDVNDTWATTLTGMEPGLELYMNAEGDTPLQLLDKSRNHRLSQFTEVAPMNGVIDRTYFKVNCVGCFNGSDLTCFPLQEGYIGRCGDGLVLGEEECDGGQGCSENCTCLPGWDHRGLPYCLPAIPASCNSSGSAAACAFLLDTGCDCNCMATAGIPCLLNHGCDITKSSLEFYVNFVACIAACPSSHTCYALFPEFCQRWTTREACSTNNCSWCFDSCTTTKASCPKFCGDGRVLDCETCDDGNNVPGDGCTNCAVDAGWQCDIEVEPSACVKLVVSSSEPHESGISGGAIAVIVIGAVLAGAAIIASLLAIPVIVSRHKKRVKMSDHLSPPGSPAGVTMDTFHEASSFDPTTSKFVDVTLFPLKIDTPALSFGLDHAPVETALASKFAINNPGKKLHWRLSPDTEVRYTLAFNPFEGVIGSHENVSISVQMIVHCTTSLHLKIPLIVWETDEKDLRHTFLQLDLVTKLSTRLDPDELKLTQPPIGEGSFGTVFRGTYRTQDVAIKVLKNQSWGPKISEFHREMKLMEGLRSPFIINFVGTVLFPGRMCIVTEFMPYGSLHTLVHKENLSFLIKVRMGLDCARGMTYLHSCKIMHRDLKPDNLLVLSIHEIDPVCCKLTDFGSTREVGEEISKNYTKGVGTPSYMAPEVLQDQGYSVSADVYSFGILLHECFTAKPPFSEFGFQKPWQTADHVIKGGRMTIPEACPEAYADLVKKCWSQNPADRPTFQDAMLALDAIFVPLAREKYPQADIKSEMQKSARTEPASLLSLSAITSSDGRISRPATMTGPGGLSHDSSKTPTANSTGPTPAVNETCKPGTSSSARKSAFSLSSTSDSGSDSESDSESAGSPKPASKEETKGDEAEALKKMASSALSSAGSDPQSK